MQDANSGFGVRGASRPGVASHGPRTMLVTLGRLMADTNHTEMPTAWLIRAGSTGEREDFVLGHGLAFGGWDDLPDLSGISSRGEMKGILRRLLPGRSKMSVANYSGQLWALRAHVSVGDLVVLPRKKTRQIAIGVVTQEYWYRDDPDPGRRHVVSVDWKRTDVPLGGRPRGSPELTELATNHLRGQV